MPERWRDMGLLIALAVVLMILMVDLLVLRFGYDSRDGRDWQSWSRPQ